MKIIIGGPPHSGKSCLRFGLREAVKRLSSNVYPFFVTANPDGEGSWFHETASDHPELARKLKATFKGKHTPELATIYSEWVRECLVPLLFVDIGGRVTEFNRTVCQHATHSILVYSDEDKLFEWREFCESLDLVIIAELHSQLDANSDQHLLQDDDGCYRGIVPGLERGDDTIPDRPVIVELADCLVQLVKDDFTNNSDNTLRSMATYEIDVDDNLLLIKFGSVNAQNDEIVLEATRRLDELKASGELAGGELLKINGAASLPVAMSIAHSTGHLYQAIACFDPKLSKYVVVIAHGDKYQLGQLLD